MTPEERVAQAVRDRERYIDIDQSSDWVEEVVAPVIAVMREQGWTVTPPEASDA